MDRRRFIRSLSGALLLLQGNTLLAADHPGYAARKPLLRFAVASDLHFGQADTPYQNYLDAAVQQLTAMHKRIKLDFGVLNGDIVHDDSRFFAPVRQALDKLPFVYYVTQGNHDHATAAQWEQAWDQPVNFTVVKDRTVLLFATTSNEKGKYLPPDLDWLAAQFEQYKWASHFLLFIHIPPIKWTRHAIQSDDFMTLVSQQPKLRAVFHGHEHDQDGVKWKHNIPFLFDSHLGGNWGTDYRGYRIIDLYRDVSLITYIMNPDDRIHQLDLKAGLTVPDTV